MQRKEVAAAGPPFVRYRTFGDQETDVEIGIPVSAPPTGDGRITSGELPGGPAITTWHLGSHATLADAYARLQSSLTDQNRERRRRVGDLQLDRRRGRAGPAVLART